MHLSREAYRTIKKMNKLELENFIESQRVDAYNLGVQDVSATITDKIVRGIKNTPGIGDKRYKDILNSIVEEMNGSSNITETIDEECNDD